MMTSLSRALWRRRWRGLTAALGIAALFSVTACGPSTPDPAPTAASSTAPPAHTQPSEPIPDPESFPLPNDETLWETSTGAGAEDDEISIVGITPLFGMYVECVHPASVTVTTTQLGVELEPWHVVCDGVLNRRETVTDPSLGALEQVRITVEGDGAWGFAVTRIERGAHG